MNNAAKKRMVGILIAVLKTYMDATQKRFQTLLFGDDLFENQVFMHKIVECTTNASVLKIENYYEEIIPQQSDATFKSHFRVSRMQFQVIVQLIGQSDRFKKKNQQLFGGRNQICPEKALLVTLWTLATPDSYRSISERFNIAKSTVYIAINTVIRVIVEELCPLFIKWPTNIKKPTVAIQFSTYGIPNCIGAIDGCHIPIKKPTANGADYFNRKKFYSLVLQAVCTSDLLFTDVDVRWPGSVHDGRVLRTSDIYPLGDELCQPNYYIIGDSAYPLKKWLVTPFKDFGHLTAQQRYYNTQLSKTRVAIENAFSLLKGRFRRLKDELNREKLEDYVTTIVACCVLHNICLLHNEEDIDVFIEEGRDPRHIRMVQGPYAAVEDGLNVRNNLLLSLWNNRIRN